MNTKSQSAFLCRLMRRGLDTRCLRPTLFVPRRTKVLLSDHGITLAIAHENDKRVKDASPAARPLRLATAAQIYAKFEEALTDTDGLTGAHCIHELWMRGEMAIHIERAMDRLWSRAAASIPEWLPMRYIEWLPLAYEVAGRFQATKRGRTNLYFVLLDYSDSRPEPYGIYVGISQYPPAQRFDQHKAGIRAAGCVLRRGLEVLTGPTLHLQQISRPEAARFEEQIAEALRAEGLFVKGGH